MRADRWRGAQTMRRALRDAAQAGRRTARAAEAPAPGKGERAIDVPLDATTGFRLDRSQLDAAEMH